MKYDARACHFNMDTGCVELLLRDGRMISIDCTGVEDELDVTMLQRPAGLRGFDVEWRSGEIFEKRNREPWVGRLKAKQKQGAPLNEQHPICPTVFGLTNRVFLYVGKTKGVQWRMRPIFIVQDALHDSPVG